MSRRPFDYYELRNICVKQWVANLLKRNFEIRLMGRFRKLFKRSSINNVLSFLEIFDPTPPPVTSLRIFNWREKSLKGQGAAGRNL